MQSAYPPEAGAGAGGTAGAGMSLWRPAHTPPAVRPAADGEYIPHPMILHVLAPGPVGGLESVVRLLAAGQAARGRQVAAALILDPGGEDHPLAAALAAAGVRVAPIVVPPRAYLAERSAIAALCRELAPRVVHTHGYRADVIGGSATRALRLPTVATVHGFTGGGRKNRFYEWLQTRAYRRFGAVIAVSRPLVSRLTARGIPPERIHCVPNAYVSPVAPLPRGAARGALGLPASEPGLRLGWIGRLSREKGADVLVRAMALVPPDRPLALSVLGDGRERAALVALAAELGVGGRIRWHGTVPDAGRLYAAFDGFVLSSRTEGTPIALFEAMAARVPIVATAVGGVPDVVRGTEALLVPSEDPAALARALGTLHDEPEAARVRAEAALARLGVEFALGPWLDRHDRLYDSLARI